MSKKTLSPKLKMTKIHSWLSDLLFPIRFHFKIRKLIHRNDDMATGYILGKQGMTALESIREVEKNCPFLLNKIDVIHGHAMFVSDLESGYYGKWKPKQFEIDARLP